jgi:hypothetical protein
VFTRRRSVVALAVVIGLLLVWVLVRQVWQVHEVTGVVMWSGQPVAEAVVRVKTTDFTARTDQDGAFTLSGFPGDFDVDVAAWAHGFYISGRTVRPWDGNVVIAIESYTTEDNPDYEWVVPKIDDRSTWLDLAIRAGLTTASWFSETNAFRPLSERIDLACADCHGETIYDQWVVSAHAAGTGNVRLMTMYNGTDLAGQRSQPTRFVTQRDYGRVPLPPDPLEPYFGPGFKLDFPESAGSCASCHAPTAALDAPAGADLNDVSGIDAMGSHCDFCHKIVDTELDARTGLPLENLPGVMSVDLRRPEEGTQVFFGPFDDVDVGPDTLSPAQAESRICAACHDASFWGTKIYSSYSEWFASPYAAQGTTCQGCHMAPDGEMKNFAPGRGGQDRDPESIFTHSFPGASDTGLLQDTAQLEVTASRDGRSVRATVRVTNEKAGHHIPTGHPMRNIILIVRATSNGERLEYVGGQFVPDWGGVGDDDDDYGGLPGNGYAKVLEERWTEVSPTAAYWNATTVLEDTRIPALGTDVTEYEFRLPDGGGPIEISVELVFRRAFKGLAESKGWGDADVVMEAVRVVVE